jgi:uncharacterized membrane protein
MGKLAAPNMTEFERLLCLGGGGALVMYGLGRHSWPGALLALAGAGLLYQGATAHCFVYQAMDIHAAGPDQGVEVEKTITINRPPEEVYRFWRNLENLPRFMKHVESVTSFGDGRSHWVVRAPAGRTVEWDAEITSEQEGELLSWRSLPDAEVENAGTVWFKSAPGGRGTEVKVRLDYRPPGGGVGAFVARLFGEEPQQQVADDLRRLKQVLEAGEIATTEGQPSGRKLEVSR